ncbi:hypothetical protein EsH8_XI_000086 [Colletotrichum jinshuiense]
MSTPTAERKAKKASQHYGGAPDIPPRSASVFLVALDQTIIATVLGAITTEFRSVRDIGWYGAAYLLTATALHSTSSMFVRGRKHRQDQTWLTHLYCSLPIGGVALAFIFLLLKTNRKNNPRGLGLLGRVLELDLIGASMLIIGLFVGSVLRAIIFIGIQIRKGDAGMLPPRFCKSKDVMCAMIFSVLVGAVFFPLIYYLSLFFQGVQGDTAVQAGIGLLPLLLSCVVTSIVGDDLITAFSYYNPVILPSMVMFTVGCGLITTLNLDLPTREWLGFQVLAGLGLGAGFQVPVLVVQATLPLEDVPVASACVQLFQSLGGSIFIAVAQTVFQNGLIRGIERDTPRMDGQLFINSGASQIRSILAQLDQEQALDAVLNAYLIPAFAKF